MPRKKKSKGVRKEQLYIITGMLALILIMLLAIFLKPAIQRFYLETFIRFEPSEGIGDGRVPEPAPRGAVSPTPRPSSGQVSPIGPTPLQGSFTELFSGVGWKNPINSTVYQDFKTLTISFPPAYEISSVSSPGFVGSVVSGDTVTVGSRTFTAGVEKIGEQYEGRLYEIAGGGRTPVSIGPIFTSQYPGRIVFGTDNESKIFLFYSAYQGKAFEIAVTPIGLINDYSSIFNARVMEEGRIDPQIFHKSGSPRGEAGAWWIFSANDTPKLLRIRSGLAHDLTNDLIGQIGPAGQIVAAPAPEESTIYLISGGKTYRLRDLGFKRSGKLAWESLRLNAWEGEIVRGRFTRIDAGDDGGNIRYFLSNDGGRSWAEAKLGQFVQFETKGGDFRWRAELEESNNQFTSPWIKIIGVEYYILRK